jgi:hypothetical protein
MVQEEGCQVRPQGHRRVINTFREGVKEVAQQA